MNLIYTTMKYAIISPKSYGDIKALPLKSAKDILSKGDHYIIAQCDSKENAEGLIMGLKVHSVVEKYAGHLPNEMKASFKSEIAQLATSMYNEIVK